MRKSLKINFILPPCELTGGPLAILEYANRLIDRGHEVTVTTYPEFMWPKSWNGKPFSWFKFNGKVLYSRDSILKRAFMKLLPKFLLKLVMSGTNGRNENLTRSSNWREVYNELIAQFYVIGCVPDCDLNIATLWSTAYSAYFSKKGKPVYFMQHYEEVFYPNDVLLKLLARISYELPIYKVANSSWLQRQIQSKYRQFVPFSNNAVDLNDFGTQPKLSEKDGKIRIITFSRPEMWKGFPDAVAAMQKVKNEFGEKVEWHVFGRYVDELPSNNPYAPYIFHKGLPFKELAKLYAQCDIAICCSWYESFPLPPLEAMASGTAIVTTSEGMEDYVSNRINALAVKPRDIEAIYQAVKLLIQDQSLREQLAKEGIRTANSFGWDIAVNVREKILLDIYNDKTNYNIFEPLSLGFTDAFGIPFERMPEDLGIKENEIISYKGMIFKIENGAKRHISNPKVFSEIVPKDCVPKEIDALTFLRIPLGFPI